MATAYFHHAPVSKATQPRPYRACDNFRYITRKAAVTRVFSERMPVQWHAVQRFLKDREDRIRKNGRVCDKFIIGVPREFSPEAAEQVLRGFGNRVGKGRTPFLVAFHWNDHNPHAHIIFIDADVETGKRVFGTSEKRSTESLKFEWAEVVNGRFKEMGLDTRIKFGTLTEEMQAEIEAANENATHHIADARQMITDHIEDNLALVSEPSPTETKVLKPPTLEELAADAADLGRVDYEEELQAELARRGMTEADLPDPYARIEQDAHMADMDEDLAEVDTPRVEWAGEHTPAEKARHAAQLAEDLTRIRTLFHELAHATAHPTRLNREMGKRFGDDAYAMEELVAELASAFLCARTGSTYSNENAEYIGAWVKRMKQDSRAIFTAASQAAKAADWLYDRSVPQKAAA